MNRPPGTGLLHWAIPAMLLVGAVSVATGGRDLTESFSDLQALSEPPRLAGVVWLQRAVSLLLVISAMVQVFNHIALARRIPSPTLLATFLIFWVGTIGLPAVFGAHPTISHELLYAPAMGVAACLVAPEERDRIMRAGRDTLMVLMLVGLALIPIRSHLVMDPNYSAGLIHGLPRFAGLTAHPVTQGALAQIATLLLWAFPYRRAWVDRGAWLMTLGVLVIAQSKAAWIAFGICLLAIAGVRHGGAAWRRISDPRHGNALGVLVISLACAMTVVLAIAMIVGDASGQFLNFMDSSEGARLTSMTGRDRIWAIAAQEWRSHPVFGYGLTLWDSLYRTHIDLPHATHAHNQFMDDAARAGSVGVTALLVYATTLGFMSMRYAQATAGLSLAFFLSLALSAVSEVPLALIGYGTDLFTHLLWLVTLVAAASTAQPHRPAGARGMRYGVAP